MTKKLLLIVNNITGNNRNAVRTFDIVRNFSKYGYEVTVFPVYPESQLSLQEYLERYQYDRVVCVGGDGTLSHTVNNVMKLDYKPVIGYLPAGTTNDFSKNFDLTTDIDTACEIIASECSVEYEHLRELIKPFPGCIELLEALQAKDIRCGLVSTRRTDSMEMHLEIFGMTQYFQTIIGTDKVANNKPDPEGIFKGMDELGVSREECMYVGDSASDIMAGHLAGVLTAGIITNEHKRPAVETAGPDYMLDELISLVSLIDML